MKLTGSLTLLIKEKPMESRTQSYWINAVYTGLILVLLLPALTDAKQAPLSSAMKSLLGQANSMYLSRFGTNVDKLVNEAPMTFASILGVTIQRQRNYAYDNPVYEDNYLKLRGECIALLELVAKQKNFQNPKDGSRMTADDLNGEFSEGISGIPNNFFYEKFGFDPAVANLPMILDQVGPVHQGGSWEPHGKVPVRQEEPDGINLFGLKAGASETTSNYQPNTGGFPPVDVILGTWQNNYSKKRITFRHQGNKIAGSVVFTHTHHKSGPYNETVTFIVHSNEEVNAFGGQLKIRKYNCTKTRVMSRAPFNQYNSSENERVNVCPDGKGGYYISLFSGDHWVKIN